MMPRRHERDYGAREAKDLFRKLRPRAAGRIKKGATFIFAQPAYSGWVAFANGHQIDLGRHEIFLSLTIPDEIEYIEFASDLGYAWLGLSIAALGILLFLVVIGFLRRPLHDPRGWASK